MYGFLASSASPRDGFQGPRINEAKSSNMKNDRIYSSLFALLFWKFTALDEFLFRGFHTAFELLLFTLNG